MLKPRVILHATDFSQRSAYAFELARSIARAEGAELVLLHVLPSIGDSVARQKAEHALGHLVKSDPMVVMRWTTLSGDPAADILWMAREISADLVVLAASGKSGLPALLSRSVSRTVERRARCPVVRLQVPGVWLSEQTDERDRCVYCDAPRTDSGVLGGFKNRHRRNGKAHSDPAVLVEPEVYPQI